MNDNNDDDDDGEHEVKKIDGKQYVKLLSAIKVSIRSAQGKVARTVNNQLIELYLSVGKYICDTQKKHSWGDGIIQQLSKDLKIEFPGLSGFSARNLRNMRIVYQSFHGDTIWQQLVAKLPWGHTLVLLSKINDPQQRKFYGNQAIINIWTFWGGFWPKSRKFFA